MIVSSAYLLVGSNVVSRMTLTILCVCGTFRHGEVFPVISPDWPHSRGPSRPAVIGRDLDSLSTRSVAKH